MSERNFRVDLSLCCILGRFRLACDRQCFYKLISQLLKKKILSINLATLCTEHYDRLRYMCILIGWISPCTNGILYTTIQCSAIVDYEGH